MTVTCPDCGKEFPADDARYQGHRGYHKAHPESIKKAPKETSPPSTKQSSTPPSDSTVTTPSTGTPTRLEPITFGIDTGKPPPMEEIPGFAEEEKKEEKPETQKATLAEERKAGVSAIAALILPLMEMWNRTIEGGSAFPSDPATMKLTKDDAEMVAQAVILVDQKNGGPLSKTLGSEEYGAEIFLVGVSVGIGIKMYMGLRLMQSRRKGPRSAAPSTEELRKPLGERVADSLKNLVAPPKQEKKEEESTPETKLSPDEFFEEAKKYQERAISP